MSSEELVRECTQSRETAAWEEFVERFHRLISSVALRTARHWGEPSRQVLDDLIQDTYLKLCDHDYRLLRDFEAQHPESIFGFLKVVTANVVHDYFRGRYAEKRGSGQAQSSLEAEGVVARPAEMFSGAKAIERQVLLQEIEQCLVQCAPGDEHKRDRLIFWLYYRHGLTASAIASLPLGLGTKGVESIILRVTRLVRNHILGTAKQQRSERKDGEGFQPAESF